MNILEIDVNSHIQDIIDAYSEVFGQEYRDTIEKKIKNTKFVIYNNTDGIWSYKSFLRMCKRKELAIKFLKQINVDVSEYEKNSYAENLDEHIETLLNEYIGGYDDGISLMMQKINVKGIKAFDIIDEEVNSERINDIKENRIKLLNFLRGKEDNKITEQNFDDFSKTDEYKMLLSKINTYLDIHKQILKEYQEFIDETEIYQEYCNNEDKREQDIYNAKKKEVFEKIFPQIPSEILEKLEEKSSDDEKCNSLLARNLDSKFYIEYFSEEDSKKLENDDVNESEKNLISYFRMRYFESMGIDVGSIINITYEEYKERMLEEKYKKLIPPKDLVEIIAKTREEKYEEAQRQYVYESKYFIENIGEFGDNENNKEEFYTKYKQQSVCVAGGSNGNNEFIPILFYTVRSGDSGVLDYSFLHEICHIIESSGNSNNKSMISGFDRLKVDAKLNPYNSQKRKYERLNENIADIFAIEARNILHNKGIYILEPQELIIEDVKDRNTSSITKKMLNQFIAKYREYIIKARISGNIEELLNVVGTENFEELNDTINKVDYLVYQGLETKLKSKQNEDSLVEEYNKQLKRLDKVYSDMDIYYSKYNLAQEER